MSCYIGATGLDIFDDAIANAIEETTNTLTNLITTQDNLQAGYSSNYVLSTSNILVGRISDTSNYVLSTSNILVGRISDTSNYVLSTSNILVERVKQLEDRVDDLEGTEGDAGDPDADPPIPPIPPTGNYAILATLGVLTAGATATAIVLADLTDDVNDLDDKVDLNAIYGSNYSDKVGRWGSNYTDLIGKYTSNYADKVGLWSSNYSDKVGIYSSNYTDLVAKYTSNYADKVGLWGSNYTDLVAKYTSNYADKVGLWGSNYTDLVGKYTSNYADKVGVWGSNYTDLQVKYTSNYVERLTTGLGTNYWTEQNTNNIYLNKTGNVGIGTNIPQTKLHIYQDTINDTKLTIQNNFTSGGSGGAITSSPSATTTGTTGNYTYQVFTYTTETGGTGSGQTLYTITAPAGGVVCDVLVVGGGGGGGKFGGGAGGGAILFATNITLTSGSLRVGKGGLGAVQGSVVNGVNGVDSSITINSIQYIAKGGGGGGTRLANTNGQNGSAGGSGGGGSHSNDAVSQGLGGASNKNTYANFQSFGNAGGLGRPGTVGGDPNHASGGGGGAGSAGGNFSLTTGGGNGGAGIDYSSYFGSSVGHNGWFAGGGGGNTYQGVGVGGYGNGGNGLFGGGGIGGFDGGTEYSGGDGLPNTGGGGGGAKYDGGTNEDLNGGNGGSGVVIIRYLSSSSSSSLELVRGTTTDGFVDYSVGNYDSDFKIKSVNAGTPTDRMIINSSGNVGIGGSVGIGTTALTQLHIYNASASTIRLETGTSGKSSIEFAVGTLTDAITDYRIINDAYELKFQYQDNLVSYGGAGSDIMVINDKGADFKKKAYFDGIVGIKTPPDILYSLDVSGDVRYLSGNVGIGVEPSAGAYRLNVAGDVNIEGIGNKYYVNNTPIVSSQWATSGTTIEYNTGSVGIGTSALTYKLNVNGSINCTSILVNGATLDYNALNNKPITLIPTTTNLQLASGYNFLVGGNVGIGTTNSATYKVDVNGSLNATNLFIGGTALSGSKWTYTPSTTKIYYNAGNVGINTTDPGTYNLNLNGSQFINNQLIFSNRTRGQDNFPTNKIRLWGDGTSSTGSYGVGISEVGFDYFAGLNHRFYTGTTGADFGTERMRIATNGNVGIGTTDPGTYKLNVNGDTFVNNFLGFSALYNGAGANFPCNKINLYDATTTKQYGFGISAGTVDYFTNVNHRWYSGTLNSSFGTQRMILDGGGNLTTTGAIITPSYILSNDSVYARNSFDARMYCDATGVFLNFGDFNTGNATLFQLNSSGGTTNINSGSNRSIYFRTNTYSWLFGGTSGVSYNALNTTTWNVVSDQRIKTNIKKANLKICYDNIKNINLYRYNYIDGFKNGIEDKTQLGYIAQQVHSVFPKSVLRTKTRIEDKREIPDLCGVDASQINFTLFGAVKQLIKVVEKQSKRIKKLEMQLGIIDDDIADEADDDADEPYERIICDEVDIDTIEPSEPEGV